MNKILEYQKLEGEIINIDKKVSQSPAMKAIEQANSNANNAKTEMKELDKRAGELLTSFKKLQDIMQHNIQNIQYLDKQKLDNADKAQIKKLYDNIQKVNNNLNIIEQRLNDINKNIDGVLKKFKRVKEQVNVSKEKKSKAQDEVEKLKKSFEKQKNEIEDKMNALEKDIPSKTMETYQRKRKENIYPVYVGVINEQNQMRCGGCKSIIPVGRTSKLKSDNFIECEECRRIIYIDDDK